MRNKEKNTHSANEKVVSNRYSMVWGLSAAALCMLITPNVYAEVSNDVSAIAQASQSSKTVKGQVIDETGEPMIGVSVVVKGTQIGTITDFDGNFILDVPAGNNALEVSYIGYTKQTITVGNRTHINVSMAADTQNLDEVLVIGYGTVKKRDLTGAVASVKSEDITLNPGTNPMQALQGRVAGLDITTESGQPGATPNVQMRGTRSMTASGSPLYLIDGMPGDITTLNPNDIESVEVLKDASSTAVYGSAGANGIIIVTTKSAKDGKTNVNFNAYASFNAFPMLPEMRSGESYMQALRDANTGMGMNWESKNDDYKLMSEEAYAAHKNNQYINWADELMQTAMTQNYSLSVSGGTEKTKGYFSLNFTDDNGQYQGDNYKVYSTNIKVDHKIRPWMKAGINLQGSYIHHNRAYAKLMNALTSVPLGSIYNEEGEMNVTPVIGGSMINLLLNTQDGVYKNQRQNSKFYITPNIELNPIKGLSIVSRLTAQLLNSRTNLFHGVGSYQYYEKEGINAVGPGEGSLARITESKSYNYKWENIATYNFKIAQEHDFTIVGATSWEDKVNNQSEIQQTHIANNKFQWHNIKGDTNSKSTSNYVMEKRLGYIGRLSYSYNGKYLLSGSFRYDGASVLAAGNQWDIYPAVSGGWRISDENFMESTKSWMDNMKIRFGYGKTGMASIDPYSSMSSLEVGNTSIGGETVQTYYQSKFFKNTDLCWENSYNTNIGIDFSLLNGRIDVVADYYFTKTKGVIWDRPLPVVNGSFNASTQYVSTMNICETKNNGIELTVNTRNIDKKNFKWNSTLTFTKNNEEITKLIGGAANNIKDPNSDFTFSLGHPVNSYFKYKIDGIWQKGEEADAAVFGREPGDLKINVPGLRKASNGVYYKIDEDGDRIEYTAENKYVLSDNDLQTIGQKSPKWTLGFQNTFNYKDFDLTIYMYARFGQMIKYDLLGYYDPTGVGNFPKYFDYWTENNPSNDFPAINANKSIKDYIGYESLNYVDGSFFKIKNITIGYNLPSKYSKKAGMEKFRVYGTVTNPFVFAKSHLLKEYDPEMNGSLNYPLTKQFVVGVNISF